MKIKNECITIKNGKKVYDFRNLILDDYLKRFVDRQTENTLFNTIFKKLDLEYCLLKFDEPLDYNESSKIPNETFDICIMKQNNSIQTINNANVTIEYNYVLNEDTAIYDYQQSKTTKLKDYYGKKISAIGFNGYWTRSTFVADKPLYVAAILDVSKYNILLQENQVFTITRKDNISSNAYFYSSDIEKVKGALHLAPKGGGKILKDKQIINDEGETVTKKYWGTMAAIHSVGFSNNTTSMAEEYVLNVPYTDATMTKNNNEIVITGINNKEQIPLLFTSFYTSNLRIKSNLSVPTEETYKYVIIKYKVYQNYTYPNGDDIKDGYEDTEYYYLMAIPCTKGEKEIKIKYERS